MRSADPGSAAQSDNAAVMQFSQVMLGVKAPRESELRGVVNDRVPRDFEHNRDAGPQCSPPWGGGGVSAYPT